MKKVYLNPHQSPLTVDEVRDFTEMVSSIREALAKDGELHSIQDILNLIFGPHNPKEDDPHTGYNTGFSNSMKETATTTPGTHKIFPYEYPDYQLLSPAEKLPILINKAKMLSKRN